MANITTTTADKLIGEVWSTEVLEEIQQNLVLADRVRRFDRQLRSGDVLHIPVFGGSTALQKAAGTAVTYEADTETEVNITINQHWYNAYLLEDIVKIQTNYDLRRIYTEQSGYAVAKAIDTSIAGLHAGFSQNVAAGAAIEDAEILTAVEFLDIANAPRDNRSFVVHAEAMSDIRALSKFTYADEAGFNRGVQVGGNNGRVANVYGVDVYMSNNVVETAGAPNVLHNLMFHRDAIGLAVQKRPTTESEYSVDFIGTKVVTHVLYGLSELRDTFAVDVELNS